MVGSCNDAAVVLAEHVSGSVEDFSILMNEKIHVCMSRELKRNKA